MCLKLFYKKSILSKNHLYGIIYNNKRKKITMDPIRRCQYENCGKVLTNRRPNVKFCGDNCRKHHATYLKRDNDRFNNEKKIYEDLLQEAKLYENKDLLDLYKIIYK